MLRWSGHALDIEVDLDAVATGTGEVGLTHGAELLAFTDALAGFDEPSIEQARTRLVDAAGVEFMIDAAAVAANFEMMTRVADGTGASFTDAQHTGRAAMAARFGVAPRSGVATSSGGRLT